MNSKITIDQERIKDFCQKKGICKLSLFGSVLREDFDAKSDVDVLVEFHPDQIPGFFELVRAEDELSIILGGRKVDMVTEKFLHKLIRQRVINNMETLYNES